MDRLKPLTQNWIKFAEKSWNKLQIKDQPSVLDLPVEIILQIFSYLQHDFLLKSVALVCKEWNDLSKDQSLWRCLSLNMNKLVSFNFSSISIHFPHLQKLSVQQGNIEDDCSFFELTNMQELSLTFCKISDGTAGAFETYFNKNASSLRLLNLEGSEVCSETLDKIFILETLRNLNLSHCIHLQNASLIKILENCTHLELLDLDGINFLRDYAINSIFELRSDSLINLTVDGDHLSDKAFINLRDCNKLSTLNIAFCENLSDVILYQIMKFKHLKKLKLRKGYLFTTIGLNTLFKDGNLFNITHLNLSECSLFDNSNLMAVADCCQCLVSLNLCWCWEVTDESLCYLVKKCPDLIIMNLTGLVRIQGDFILDLKQGLLKNLRLVDLEQCGLVKDELLFDLFKLRPNLRILSFWGDVVSNEGTGGNDDDDDDEYLEIFDDNGYQDEAYNDHNNVDDVE